MPSNYLNKTDINIQNTLSVEGVTYHRLLDKLNEIGNKDKTSSSRIYRRLCYRHSKIAMFIESKGHNHRKVIIASRNLSQGGISILHSNFMYPGTKVTIDLVAIDQSITSLQGTIKRCQHCGGRVHEIGIQFEKDINLRNFLQPDPEILLHARERVDPTRMDIRLLLYANTTEFSTLMRQFMQPTNIIYSFANSEQEALDKCLESDIVLCQLDQKTMQTPETIRSMRQAGFSNPIILAGQPTNTIDAHIVYACGADMVIPWPCDEQTTLCSIGEYIFNDWTSESLETIRTCISLETKRALCMELAKLGITLDQHIRANRKPAAYDSCLRIRMISCLLELSTLKSTVDTLTERFANENSLEPFQSELTEIATVCKNMRSMAA